MIVKQKQSKACDCCAIIVSEISLKWTKRVDKKELCVTCVEIKYSVAILIKRIFMMVECVAKDTTHL